MYTYSIVFLGYYCNVDVFFILQVNFVRVTAMCALRTRMSHRATAEQRCGE